MAQEALSKDLELSRIFALAMRAIARRSVGLILIAAITILAPNLLITRLQPEFTSIFTWPFLIWWLESIPIGAVSAIFGAWIAFQLVADEDDPPPNPLGVVLARSFPLYMTALVIGIGGTLGTMALVIPGIIWSVMCQVAVPSAALERTGPFEAIRRSFRLTENRLWAIFGFSLAVILPVSLAGQLLQWWAVGWQVDELERSDLVRFVLQPIFNTIVAILDYALAAAFYQELMRLPRLHKEGAAA